MKKSRFFASLTLLFMVIMLAGCSSKNDIYKKAVKDYNRTLVTVLENGEIDLLNSVATEKEVRRMHLFLNHMNEENRKISAKLKKLKFGTVSVNHPQKGPVPPRQQIGKSFKNYEHVEVRTNELWEYTYLEAKTGERVEGPMRIEYDATYWLVKPEEKWVVSEVYFLEKPVQ